MRESIFLSCFNRIKKKLTSMAGRVGSKPKLVVANYFASSSEDENEKEKAEVIDLQLPDFEPFLLHSEDTGKN